MNTKLKQFGGDILANIKTTGLLLWNKGVALLALLFIIAAYLGKSDHPLLEFFYAGVMLASIAIGAPLFRLLVFPHAARMAETGQLKTKISMSNVSPALIHYWIATIVSYTATILCVTSLL